jgi:hypothetical protein
MNFEPEYKPLFSVGKTADVLEINHEHHCVTLTVHIHCWEHEMQSAKVLQEANTIAHKVKTYLVAEGFIKNQDGWHFSVSVMGHPPTE